VGLCRPGRVSRSRRQTTAFRLQDKIAFVTGGWYGHWRGNREPLDAVVASIVAEEGAPHDIRVNVVIPAADGGRLSVLVTAL